jgi:DNA-binding IclR family transcriptional regulator
LARAQFGRSGPAESTLRREIRKIAAAGYSEARNESRAGLADTAVPVRGGGAGPHAALASSHFMAEIRGSRPRDILRLLRAAADEIGATPAD